MSDSEEQRKLIEATSMETGSKETPSEETALKEMPAEETTLAETPTEDATSTETSAEETTSGGEGSSDIEAKTQIKSEGEEAGEEGVKKQESVALVSATQGDQSKSLVKVEDVEVDDDSETDPRKQQWSESLKARLFGSADKDGNFFSFMFLDKIFGETRPCIHCGARGSAKVPPGDNSLQLYVIEEGIIGSQNIMCEKCGKLERVVSGDDPSLMPQDPRLIIKGMEIRDLCRKITHYEVLHDLMEMLHIAAMDDGVSRKEKHSGVAAFMLQNARKICEEWCRPEHAELRLRKYLRLREETLLTKYKPTFTPDCTEEFKEMYEMMAQSFRQNRADVLTILQVLKESLIDNPSRSSFMVWLGMAMTHSENYREFKRLYDPRSFMRLESTEYEEIHERYLGLDAPVGIKKIPVVFILFEIPRFYHYVDFLNQRLGKRKPRTFLTSEEREELRGIEEEAAKSGVGRASRKRTKKKKTMISPEAHFDILTQQEDLDRERVYQSCRDKKAQSEAAELGIDLPKAIQPATAPKAIKKSSKDPPLPIEAGSSKDGGSNVVPEEEGLTKAQIKRRRKKALAAGMKTTEGITGVDDDDGGGGATLVTKETEAQGTSKATKGKATTSEDRPTKGEGSVTNDNSKDKTVATVTNDKPAMASESKAIEPMETPNARVAPVESHPEPPMESHPVPPVETHPVPPVECHPVPPVESHPVPPVETHPVPPVDSHPEPPVESHPEPPVESHPVPPVESHPVPPTDPPRAYSPTTRVEDADPQVVKDIITKYTESIPDKPPEEMEELSPEQMRIMENIMRNMDLETLRQTMEDLESDYNVEHGIAPKPPPETAKPKAASSSSGVEVRKKEEKAPDVVELSPMAQEERSKMAKAFFNAFKENAAATYLTEHIKKKMTSELAATSYPVVADLLEFANSLAAPLPDKPVEPTRVSVLLDPFNMCQDGSDPSCNCIGFMKIKNTVRSPSQPPAPKPSRKKASAAKAKQNIQDPIKARLAQLMAERVDKKEEGEEQEGEGEAKGKGEQQLSKDYYSLEIRYLPFSIEKAIQRARGVEMESFPITKRDLKVMMTAVEKHGISHREERHQDTVSLVCFPSEYKLDELLVKTLTKGMNDDPEIAGCVRRIEAEARRRGAFGPPGAGGGRSAFGPPGAGAHAGKASDSGLTPGMFPSLEAYRVNAPVDSTPPVGRSATKRAKRQNLKTARKTLKNSSDTQAIMVTEMDSEMLKSQGYKVDTNYPTATVVANKDGTILHVLDGPQTPEQVKEFLSKRYNIIAQQAGPGYVTLPSKDRLGGVLVDPNKFGSADDTTGPNDKLIGNRKKLRSKKKAIQEKQISSLTQFPGLPRPKNPYSIPLGFWATQDGPWPEGLEYGTEYHSDREIICESDDEDLVKAIDKDEFGNHSMLMRLELGTVDVPDEKAAETVMQRYMEPADLGPGIDPKVPRYIIPSNGASAAASAPSRKLPAGTTREDIPFIMKYATPHKQMRAMDAMKIPYKYELTQVLTPHLNKDGEVVPSAPKRRALLSKITLLPKSRYRSLNPQPAEEEKVEKVEEGVAEVKEEEVPKISKSQRKKMKRKQKYASLQQDSASSAQNSSPPAEDLPDPLDPDEVVRSKLDPPHGLGDEGSGSESSEGSHMSSATRNRLKFCDNCGKEILTRVQACAGCKKVAYCNFRCQKASWKVHKKTCSYALRKDGKESTG